MFRGFSYQQELAIDCYRQSEKFKKTIAQKQAYDISALVALNIDLSLLLLVEALQNNALRCQSIFNDMHYFLERLSDAKEVNWLWGRYYTAAHLLKDTENIKIANVHLQQLSHSKPSEYNAWAWGYFLIHANHIQYNCYKEKTLDAILNLKGSDRVWGLVLLTKAAATQQDNALYQKIIQKVATHIADLPLEDYKAWAVTELRLSAVIIGDLPLSYALEKAQRDAQTEVTLNSYIKHQTGYKKDKMITSALNEVLLAKFSQITQPRSRM